MARASPTDHPWPAWFQDSVQHSQLLTNRTIRSYLLAHNAESWPELVKSTLLYGVLCLQRDFPGKPALDVTTINEASRQLHAEAALGAALPRIRSQFESLEADVGGFLAELDLNGRSADRQAASADPSRGRAPAEPVREAHTWGSGQAARAAQPGGSTCGAALAAGFVPHQVAERSARAQEAIYPDWWPKGGGAASSARRGRAKQRQQPRLAYSRPPNAPQCVVDDDLPTAAFLLVPPRLGRKACGGQEGAGTPGQGPALGPNVSHRQPAAGTGVLQYPRARPALPPAPDARGAAFPDPSAADKWRRHFGLA